MGVEFVKNPAKLLSVGMEPVVPTAHLQLMSSFAELSSSSKICKLNRVMM